MAADAPRETDRDATENEEADSGGTARSDGDPGDGTRTSEPVDDGPTPHPAFAEYASESVPSAGVGAPGKDGRLELAFARAADGRTVLARDYARVPFHVSGTLDRDPHPGATSVVVQSPNGGVAQGDRHDVRVEAREGAVARVGTGSATKVLSMEHNYGGAEVELIVDSGAHLEYLPEPTILHADARYAQTVTLDVAQDGTAVLGDVVVPGRLAREERFDFERYASRVRVRGPDGLLAEDPTHLAPGDDAAGTGVDPRAAGVLGEFAVYGTLYVVAPASESGPLCDAIAERLADEVADPDAGLDASEPRVRAAPTTLPGDAGVVVRAVGHRADPVRDALWVAWDAPRRELLESPAPKGWYH